MLDRDQVVAELKAHLLDAPAMTDDHNREMFRYSFRGPESAPQWGSLARGRLLLLLSQPHPIALRLAGAVETSHHASLLVDDLIDGALTRRGYPSFWRKFGSARCVVFAHRTVALAIEEFNACDQAVMAAGAIVDAVLAAIRQMAEAELSVAAAVPRTLQEYRQLALGKTGSLYTLIGALVAATNPTVVNDRGMLVDAMVRLGVAKQIADDLQDAHPDCRGEPFSSAAAAERNVEASVYGLVKHGVPIEEVLRYHESCKTDMLGLLSGGLVATAQTDAAISLCSSICDIPADVNIMSR